MDRFVIGNGDLGEVQFLLPVNLLELNLDDVVEIDKGKIQVYSLDGQEKAPAIGRGLNVPAMLVFRSAHDTHNAKSHDHLGNYLWSTFTSAVNAHIARLIMMHALQPWVHS